MKAENAEETRIIVYLHLLPVKSIFYSNSSEKHKHKSGIDSAKVDIRNKSLMGPKQDISSYKVLSLK